ncbi:MAG: FtsH protease activity modulator HflK [Verrucomicrobia bacterium]|nr:MAG: FtsH protease activity modulator HflK [Verrucomicrobiota bacterium]
MVIRVGNTFYRVSSRLVLAVVLVLAGIVAVSSMVYTVQAEYQAVILRFGRFAGLADPGLRFKLPFGIDKVIMVPVQRQLKQEFGFGTPGATNPHQFTSSSEQELERSMVTGDLNAVTVEWIIQYRISDPRAYLFEFRDPATTLRDLSESVMREVVGDRTVDEVITVGRQEIESEALAKLQSMVQRYGLGVSINQLQLKNVNPPPPVQPSFNEVNQAQQERERLINVANGEYNKAVPRARGEADQKIRAAEGYAVKRINEAEGDAARFNAVFAEYLKAPEVTKRRLFLETMKDVLPHISRKIILDEDAAGVLPLLQLPSGETSR